MKHLGSWFKKNFWITDVLYFDRGRRACGIRGMLFGDDCSFGVYLHCNKWRYTPDGKEIME